MPAAGTYVLHQRGMASLTEDAENMTTSRDQAISEILGDRRGGNDLSLRGKALARALKNQAPRTMTAWEWEEWYAQHGVPTEHRQPASGQWWQRLFRSSQRPGGARG
jgi:hypothetical protein